jgi:sRNA-binding protein
LTRGGARDEELRRTEFDSQGQRLFACRVDHAARVEHPPKAASVDERKVVMSAKRQQTMAKIARERAVKERRERKKEKKAAAALRKAEGTDGTPSAPEGDDGT